MKSTPKSATYEKRHTKPCRFFQKGICPLSADRCDFAHVKIQILPVKYSTGYSKPSHLGNCDHRESSLQAAPTVPIEFGKPKAATPHAVPGTETHSPQVSATAVQPAMAKVPYGPKLYPQEPVLRVPVSGRLPIIANGACAVSVPSEDLLQLIFRKGDSSPTSDVPSLSDGDSGPPSAEAPELAERWSGSPPVPSPMVYYNPSPGLFSPGAPFVHPTYAPWTSPKQVTRPESRRHGMSTRKLKALKTKQCKFFKKDGRCPQGSLCTFIHDPSAVQAEPDSPSDSSDYSSQSPSEPGSKAEESHERNIFPVTWRVIGGGVMMSGQREVCTHYKDGVCPDGDDCPYAHPWEGTDEIRTPIEASSHTSTPRAAHFPPPQTYIMTATDMGQPSPPVPELIPDTYPVAPRGCGPPSILSVREDLPPRPFSTPPRINSRGGIATPNKPHRP